MTRRLTSVVLTLSLGGGAVGAAQTPAPDVSRLVTRAEASDYAETTSYDETLTFLEAIEHIDPRRFHLTTFGETNEGRALPLMVAGPVDEATPDAVRRADRLTVWLQGAIHGGEVCGKEALLMLLRSLAAGQRDEWGDLVLLVVPIYNADGHEAMALDNRPRQHGPVGGMGERRNAQGLDLNRDHTKLESPEGRALASAIDAYAPDVIVDLHTTNGTQHGYHLTYSPPLHPNTHPSLDRLLRDEWLPFVTRRVRDAHGWAYYYYGNVFPREGPERGWRTFDHRPRFNNNYAGLRNRFGILSEAYSYASFDERVQATLWFVEETLTFAAEHASRLRQIIDAAESESVVGHSLALRAAPARSQRPVPILLGETVEEPHPVTGAPMLRRTATATRDEMFEYGRFVGTLFADAPAAYYLPASLGSAVDHLRAHGIQLSVLETSLDATVEEFVITDRIRGERAFEGHRELALEGAWRTVERRFAAGTVVLDLDQPLGRLAFTLVEPQSDDGLVNWNLMDAALDGVDVYPIARVAAPAR